MDHLDVGNANDEKDSSARRPKVKTYFINIYYLSNYIFWFLQFPELLQFHCSAPDVEIMDLSLG